MIKETGHFQSIETAFLPENLKQAKTIRAMVWRQTADGLEFLLLKLNQAEAESQNRGIEWHPPGGRKDDPDESDQETGLRETFEETQIPASQLKFGQLVHEDAWLGYYDGEPGYQFNASFYEYEYNGPDVPLKLSREHDDGGWFSFARLPEGTTPEARIAIAKIVDLQENISG